MRHSAAPCPGRMLISLDRMCMQVRQTGPSSAPSELGRFFAPDRAHRGGYRHRAWVRRAQPGGVGAVRAERLIFDAVMEEAAN
jgi:hypothetical protein